VLGSLVGRLITWGLSLLGYLIYLRMRPSMPVERETWAGKESLAGAPS
jgi:hypothetical protein